MTIARLPLALLAASLLVSLAWLPARSATPAPKPSGTPHVIVVPTPKLPTEPLHTEYVVEVNKKGQVVRIKSGKGCKSQVFNTQTYGNALQMWIRKPDGSADTGLFKVTYDYDPHTKKIARNITLVSLGGSWADQPGAATVMIKTAQQEYLDALKHASPLPSLNDITGKPTPKPKPTATPQPLPT